MGYEENTGIKDHFFMLLSRSTEGMIALYTKTGKQHMEMEDVKFSFRHDKLKCLLSPIQSLGK